MEFGVHLVVNSHNSLLPVLLTEASVVVVALNFTLFAECVNLLNWQVVELLHVLLDLGLTEPIVSSEAHCLIIVRLWRAHQ